jgi:O-antigen/teichoic acid export membrane protein
LNAANASKKVLKNFGVVLRGRGIAALLTLGATALMARALPANEFGLVILLHTYVLAVRGILNFRTFEAIVRFGVPMHESGDRPGLVRLLSRTTVIDVASAILATMAGVAATGLAGQLLHWDAQMTAIAGVYSLVLLSSVINTPNGVLRLYDRFDALSVFYTVGPSIRITGVAFAWLSGAGMETFIAVWAAAFLFENGWLLVRGHLEFRRQAGVSLAGARKAYPGVAPEDKAARREFRHFIAVVYWQTNLDMLPKHLSVLLAGSLLGPAAAGMFRLARDFSSILSKPAMMLREVMFPDLARMLHGGDADFMQLGFRAVRTAAAAGLVLVLLSIPIARPVLSVIGSEYTIAATLLSLMLLAATFELAGSPLRAAAYAMGQVAPVLRIHLLGVVLFFCAFMLLAPYLGLAGIGIAACLGTMVTLLLMLRMVQRTKPG